MKRLICLLLSVALIILPACASGASDTTDSAAEEGPAAYAEEGSGAASYSDYANEAETYYADSDEEYSEFTQNGFKLVNEYPLSTFSIDVDTASYSNVRRMLNEGVPVSPSAVRVEEFINYFHYDYPQPRADAPFSLTAELTDCPWNKHH